MPAPEEQAQPQQPIAPGTPPQPAPKKQNKGLLYVLISIGVLILLALIVLILLVAANSGQGNQTPPPPPETPPAAPPTTEPPPPASEGPSIAILVPELDATVGGMFTISGTASEELQRLTVKVYDNNDTLLGTKGTELIGSDGAWSVDMDIRVSPESLTGRIVVYPNAAGESSEFTQTLNISFSEITSAGRIRLFAPLTNQISNRGPVKFRGEMKDFFEGVMNVRLMTSAGTEIFRDFIMGSGDNYGTFASFEKDIEFEPLPLAAGDAGTWELFEISAADGSETVLLTVPVRFVE